MRRTKRNSGRGLLPLLTASTVIVAIGVSAAMLFRAVAEPRFAQALGFTLFGIGLGLGLLFARWVPRGTEEYRADAGLRVSIASRWLSPRACDIGAGLSALLLLVSAVLLLRGYITSN